VSRAPRRARRPPAARPPRRPHPLPPTHPPPAAPALPRSLIRDFEREARADNMPVTELNYRKKQAVQELNGFIGLKKAYGAQAAARGELLAAGSSAAGGMTPDQMHGARVLRLPPRALPAHRRSRALSFRRAL
jgi:hypothetical protein